MAHVRGGVLVCGVLGCCALVLLACRPAGAEALFGAAEEGAVATATAAVTPAAVTPAAVTPAAASPAVASPVAASPVAASPAVASPVAASPVAASPVAASPAVASPAVASPAAAGNSDWQRYTQEEWGLSFRYPADWQVEPNPLGLTLVPPRMDGAPTGGGSILLEPYTVSPAYDLRDYVELRSRDGEHPSLEGLGITFADPAAMPFAAVGDQVVYAVSESPLLHAETVWVAQDGLVFRITGFEAPEHRYALAEVAASLAFDTEQLASLKTAGGFGGDETVLQANMARTNAPRLAEAEEAIRNRHAAATAVGPLTVYTGTSPYGPDYPGFTVQYDPAIWQFRPSQEGEPDRLQHREWDGCTLDLASGATETYGARWRSLGGQWWVEARLNPEVLAYFLSDDGGGYTFRLSVPEADPLGASLPCRRAAEQVLGTLLVSR